MTMACKFVALMVAAWVGICAAQTAPSGRIEQDVRPPPEPAKRDAISIRGLRLATQAPEGAAGVSLTLGSVEISGNTVLPTEVLAAAWQSSLGKRLTLAQVFDIAAAISAQYRQAGYVLSQAIIPEQDLPTDRPAALRVQVHEGHIGRLSFRGIEGDKLRAYMAPALAERPLTLATLERCLLVISDLAGISAQANLRAGTEPNATDLEIVVQRLPSAYSASLHNRTPQAQGRMRLELAAEWRGVLADFDRQSLQWFSAGDRRLNLVSYSGLVPIGASGLKALFGASASKAVSNLAVIQTSTDSRNASVGLLYPMRRSREANLGLRANLTGSDNRSFVQGLLISDDRVRALRTGVTLDYADAYGGLSLLDLEVSSGLSGLGATTSFTKLNVYASRLQFLGSRWSLLAALSGQASADRLPTAEQLGLGGDVFLRAYDPSEVIGESGLAGKLELRHHVEQADLGVTATVYAYVDSGQVHRKQVAAPALVYSLSAAGLGVRFNGPYRTRGYIEIAKPIHRVVASQGNTDPRGFAGIGIDF